MAGTMLFTPISSTCAIALTTDSGETSSSGQLAMLAKCTGTPPTTANVFEHGCLMNQTDSGTGTNALYQNTGSSASPVWTLLDTSLPGDTASSLVDTNGVTVVDVATVASTVNNLRVTASAAGAVSANAVTLAPVGSDSAISLTLAPKAATGILTLGLSTGSGDIILGSSSATQAVKIGNGAGIVAVNLGSVSVAGVTVSAANAATGAGITDTINLATGNAAATGIKVVNILTGTPGTSGNNRLTMGGGATSAVTVNAAATSKQAWNYIATEGGANNAITGTLLDASGANIVAATGVRVLIKLAHSLQAGANTFALSGGSAVAIKSHNNPGNDIAAAYVSGGVVDLFFDGTQWLDMSQ